MRMSKSISDKIPEISIVIVGDSQCGKTQLINRFANKSFSKVSNTVTIQDILLFNGWGKIPMDGIAAVIFCFCLNFKSLLLFPVEILNGIILKEFKIE